MLIFKYLQFKILPTMVVLLHLSFRQSEYKEIYLDHGIYQIQQLFFILQTSAVCEQVDREIYTKTTIKASFDAEYFRIQGLPDDHSQKYAQKHSLNSMHTLIHSSIVQQKKEKKILLLQRLVATEFCKFKGEKDLIGIEKVIHKIFGTLHA